jgi:hypothetical protein
VQRVFCCLAVGLMMRKLALIGLKGFYFCSQ